jgi:hypothetical protein
LTALACDIFWLIGGYSSVKALACKLAKAAWYLIAGGAGYDPKRMFGQGTPK